MKALAFLLAVVWGPGMVSAALAPRWALLAVGLPLVSALDPRRLTRGAQAALLGLLVWGALSLSWAGATALGIEQAIHLVIFAGVFVAAVEVEDLDGVLSALAWGVSVSGLLAVAQWWGWHPVQEVNPPAGLFYNRDFLAETAAVLLVWALWSRRWWFFLPLGFPVVVAGARTAWVALAVGLVAARPRLALLGVLGGGAVVLVLTAWYPDKVGTGLQRIEIWRDAVGGTTLWGHGIGSFVADYPRWEYAHSDLLEAGYELGIGSTFFVALCVGALWASFRSASLPVRAAVAGLAAEMVIAFPLHLPVSTFLAALLLGHASKASVAAAVADRRRLIRLVEPVGRDRIRPAVGSGTPAGAGAGVADARCLGSLPS